METNEISQILTNLETPNICKQSIEEKQCGDNTKEPFVHVENTILKEEMISYEKELLNNKEKDIKIEDEEYIEPEEVDDEFNNYIEENLDYPNAEFDGDGCSYKYIGKTTKNISSYICLNCDFQKIKPMCISCANNCHKPCIEKGYKIQFAMEYSSICECALNKHKIEQNKVNQTEKMEIQCNCLDIGLLKNAYIYTNENKKLICSVCQLVCYDWDETKKESETTSLCNYSKNKLFNLF